jgi:hypothetical protein
VRNDNPVQLAYLVGDFDRTLQELKSLETAATER